MLGWSCMHSGRPWMKGGSYSASFGASLRRDSERVRIRHVECLPQLGIEPAAWEIPMTILSPRRSTTSTRLRSSGGVGRGIASRPSNCHADWNRLAQQLSVTWSIGNNPSLQTRNATTPVWKIQSAWRRLRLGLGEGRRGPVVQRGVKSRGVVVVSPFSDGTAGMVEAEKQAFIQEFIAHPAVLNSFQRFWLRYSARVDCLSEPGSCQPAKSRVRSMIVVIAAPVW